MHGCGLGSAFQINAEVDSMGGVVDGGIGLATKTSPQLAAIDRAQAELRQEYNVREERRRELDFLEKGGNPLDFKFGNAASLSVQSTSLIDHHGEHFVNSEAKGSFPLTASPHGDSVESIGRPGATVCEPNTADNFDEENELLDGDRKSKQSSRRSTLAPSEQSSQMDGAQHPKESEDSAIFRPYARRNRSRPNRDGARSSTNDVLKGSAAHGSSSVLEFTIDVKELTSETNEQKDQSNQSLLIPKFPTSNGDLAAQRESFNVQSNMERDNEQGVQTVGLPIGNCAGVQLDIVESDKWRVKDDQRSEADTCKTTLEMASSEAGCVEGKEHVILTGTETPSAVATGGADNDIGSTQLSGFKDKEEGVNEGQNGNIAVGTKGFDSEFSCTLNNQGLEVNIANDFCVIQISDVTNAKEQTFEMERLQDVASCNMGVEKNDSNPVDNIAEIDSDHNFMTQVHSSDSSVVKIEDETKNFDMQKDANSMPTVDQMQQSDCLPSEGNKNLGDDSTYRREGICPGGPASMKNPVQEQHDSVLTEGISFAAPDPEVPSNACLKVLDRAREDSILEEARTIEAKRKRIAELSVLSVSDESCRRSHWDFVLEEMVWLANDFAQERLWKMTTAAQLCHRVACTSRLRFEEQNQRKKLKTVAYKLAKAVMQFWRSAETLLKNTGKTVALENCKRNFKESEGTELSKNKFGGLNKEAFNEFEIQNAGKVSANAIQGYAVRFLRYNCSQLPSLQAEEPTTPDGIADVGIMELSWHDHLNEESLFYSVPSGAMLSYRRFIESYLVQCEKAGSTMQEEVDTSMHDAAADFVCHDTSYNEEEGETSTYYSYGVAGGNKSSKLEHKKQKNFMKSFSARSYEQGSEMPFGHWNIESQQNVVIGKRPASNYGVGPAPPKRCRTSSRQRFVGPFNPGVTGAPQAPMKTDASSGDTSSFQDDHSTMLGGLQLQKGVEVESIGDFDKQLAYECTDTSAKPKKKKTAKHLGSAYDHGWQLDSTGTDEQRENSKKRLEGHLFDYNGSSGLCGQHAAKKPKLIKQPQDNTFDNMSPVAGSIPSPAASQMSNMPNANKFIKIFNGRDKGRKAKLLKISAGQQGSGSPWSTFEDQALVVLVHDMGPNWELVSDAINSTLQFKCIFRKPKECKERHKIVINKGAGDGADSAEDSGSSQSYPSTLPGIPKGSARQLFQRLQGPMDEETLKSHFEKIIMIGKRQHYRSQNDNVDAKQPVPPHNSHVIALSQVCPNNLNGGVLTPIDLCDASAPNPDVFSIGLQNSHGNGVVIPNKASASMLPTSGASSSLQGSSGVALGNNSPSSSGPFNANGRDGRYNAPRTPLPVDEQQRIQHFNQMLSARNLPHGNLSVSGPLSGADRGVRTGPSGNSMGMMTGMNRNVPMQRPGLQGMTSSPMLNPGSVISSAMVGVQSPVNLHSGTGSAPVNSMMRSRDTLHMMRPGHSAEHQRQMILPEHQMQVTQGNGQGVSALNGLSSTFANQTIAPSGQTYSGHQQHHHQIPPQQSRVLSNPHHPHLQGPSHTPVPHQQAYAIRLAKERQMQQQRFLQHQQQQQLGASGALMPHVQTQTPPISSFMPNTNQIQSQSSSEAITPSSPVTPVSFQQQHTHNLPHHGLTHGAQICASGLTNQVGKQRQRQPQQQQILQSGRHHPQQRQQSQSPQNSKVLKGMGSGNVLMYQNLSSDHHHLNGLSLPLGNQGSGKGENAMQLAQGQGIHSGTVLGAIQPSKPLVPPSSNNSQAPQKLSSVSSPNSSKQVQQTLSHSDKNTQSPVLPVTSGHLLSSSQAVPSLMMSSNHQHLQPQLQLKQISQAQTSVQRMIQSNRQKNTDMATKSCTDQGHNDQLMNDVNQISNSTTAVIAQACNDSANTMPVVASAWKPSENQFESLRPNLTSQVGSTGSPTLLNLAGSETIVSVNQGQRQLSGAMPQPVSSVPSQQLPHHQEQQLQQDHQQSPRKQLPLQLNSQQQTQHMQSAQGSLYTGPTSSKVE